MIPNCSCAEMRRMHKKAAVCLEAAAVAAEEFLPSGIVVPFPRLLLRVIAKAPQEHSGLHSSLLVALRLRQKKDAHGDRPPSNFRAALRWCFSSAHCCRPSLTRISWRWECR